MKKTVCPYCDQPIKGMYCKGCRRIVWKPEVTEITYYLNERHPGDEEHCRFHGDVMTGDMAEAKKTRKQAVSGKMGPNASGTGHKKSALSKIKTGLIIYFLLVFIGLLGPIIGAVFDMFMNLGSMHGDIAVPEPVHVPVEVEEVLMQEELEGEYDTYSYNQVVDDDTWFETVHEFTVTDSDGYVGILEISADTATGQIHGISMYTHGEEGFFRMADMVMNFMNEAGIAEDLPDGRHFYEEALLENAQEDVGYRMQYGLEVSCVEPEPDEEEAFYELAVFVPGYYTDAAE